MDWNLRLTVAVDEHHEETFSHYLSFEDPMLSKTITEMTHILEERLDVDFKI